MEEVGEEEKKKRFSLLRHESRSLRTTWTPAQRTMLSTSLGHMVTAEQGET